MEERMSGSGLRLIFDFGFADVMLALLLLLACVIAYRRTWPPVGRYKRTLLITLRSMSFILLVLFIADPACVRMQSLEKTVVVPALLDISGSMRIKDHRGRRRIDSALEGIRRLKDSAGGAGIVVIPFDSDIYPEDTDIDSISSLGRDGTDIFNSLRNAIDRYRHDNVPAVIILSDGRISRGMISGNEPVPVRVYSVGYGDTLSGTDIRVEDVDTERRLYLGTRTEVEAVIRLDNTGQRLLTIELLAGEEVVERKQVRSPEEDGTLRVTLGFRPERVGEEVISVRVGAVEGEEFTENNVGRVSVTVLKDRIGILYIDQFPDWNMTFLRSLFGRSDRYSFEIATSTGEGGYRIIPEGRKLDLSSAVSDPDRYDLIIFGDDTMLSDSERDAESIERFTDRGGSVLFLGCEDSPLIRGRSSGSLAGLLPVVRTDQFSVSYGDFFLQSASLPGNMPFAYILASAGSSGRLAPLPAAITGFKVKKGAAVPLLLLHDGEETPMMAIHRYGSGVSAALFGFPLWRWNLAGESGSSAYRAFFSGLVDYMAEGVDLPVLTVESDRGVYYSGERFEITARVGESAELSGMKGEVRKGSAGGQGPVRTFNLSPADRSGELFRSVLDPMPPGRYTVAVTGTDMSGGTMKAETGILIEPVSIEYLNRSMDRNMLRRIAEVSGGSLIEPDEILRLKDLIVARKESVTREEVVSIRSFPALFIAIIAAFAAEWGLRKLWGMV